MSLKYLRAREEVIKTGVEMLRLSHVVGTWGNISMRIEDENSFAITPSGVDYDKIKIEDVVIIDFDGNIINGELKPSIEWGLHLNVYKHRSDISAIVHTHSTYSTAFAIARKPIPASAEDLVQIVGGDVKVTNYVLPGSTELGIEAVKALEGRNACILANHGLLSAAATLKEALKIVNVVEKSAQATIFANLLGGVVELGKTDVDFMRDFYLNKYGQR
ncbi:class II aldolase/adducin family protein [Helicovermis profundi]|uniref:Class II aldolase/adducin family protein n=1 Tax=Helicovermis profundi TaxID=3065157 RepID=A0AAU9EM36_9FIRM|nr:class II aldolase/adducin family protein [Clostridia bacterium S502]